MSAITGAQIRAARALIRWRAEDVAKASGVGVATVRRAEAEDGTTSMTAPNAAAVRRVLEEAGVIFVAENGEGPGVRLRKTRPSTTEPWSPNSTSRMKDEG
ncbi:hypothetical protein SAMN05660859_0696 [Ancylobacter rudongensis]|uniref:Helix-turn-helix domain-containing protein n=1 Tax=Ancylobacter rudongensis TaxID=177413 RepID=A0A1G4PPR6_9HYPH|nr:transcriptional regulator [Ancylobacter rudongensis]SCW34267.1 hypothetical protein SAMN05660859_0696 [Ancylobacter rudongensis]